MCGSIVFAMVLLVSSSVLGFNRFWRWFLDSDDPTLWGKCGDQYGALSTLFTGLAFIGLLVTIYLQYVERLDNRKYYAQQRGLMQRQGLDASMLSFLEHMHVLANDVEDRKQLVNDIFVSLRELPEYLTQYRDRKIDAKVLTNQLNNLRNNLNRLGEWRRVFTVWIQIVERTSISGAEEKENEIKDAYIRDFWHLLSKPNRFLIYCQTALQSSATNNKCSWNTICKYFNDSDTVRRIFTALKYKDYEYTVLIHFLQENNEKQGANITLQQGRVEEIMNRLERNEITLLECPLSSPK